MIDETTIHSHAQIKDLQARSDEHNRSDQPMLVNLVSLETLSIACESYALLRPLMQSRPWWVCPELNLLSAAAGMSVELQRLEQDLLPKLMDPEAKLEPGVLKTILFMKNSAATLLHLRQGFHGALGGSDEDLVAAQVKTLSAVLKDTAVAVLEGGFSVAWLREKRIQWLLQLVTDLLATPVRFTVDSE